MVTITRKNHTVVSNLRGSQECGVVIRLNRQNRSDQGLRLLRGPIGLRGFTQVR